MAYYVKKINRNYYPPHPWVSSWTTQFECGYKSSIQFTYVTTSNDARKMLVLLVNL